ncbi:amidohydrolase [Streptomyces sp. 1222.5]|uniref:amidohydrolase n=1 Tax=Streptomyces sp. 1222.5 TaxID=1881026 RepID=UPI003EBE4A4D
MAETSSAEFPRAERVLGGLNSAVTDLAALYKDLHAHPELSFQEHRTAYLVSSHLSAYGYHVLTGVGGTGVVGVKANGPGRTVLLRADMDALPVSERTGLPYASSVHATAGSGDGTEVPVMHACGHDMHVTAMIGAARLLAQALEHWQGTVIVVFQPSEETGKGARTMVSDGLYEKVPRPHVVLGQHISSLAAGTLGYCPGPAMSAASSLHVRLFGRGGHAALPHAAVDPVVMAASTVMRLQTVTSREVGLNEQALVTVGSLNAGSKDNVIPDEAELTVNVRTFDERVHSRILKAVRRIINAEAAASAAPREPEITPLTHFPVTVNDPEVTAHTVVAFEAFFGKENVNKLPPTPISEDFTELASPIGVPSFYWHFGGLDPRGPHSTADVPGPHSPRFAPVIEPTLSTAVQAAVVAALTWLN